ncbi:MAG: molybdopterin molybdotransferase MoeA [Candidatus Omnitrophota bacterium]|nr:molybdopterin molybdotransferase MoeA [Candidatus Omnitrophota bacterium]
MIKVDDALKTVLGLISTLPPEEARLTEALDRVLAQDVYADIDIPQLDNSAMDGYAVKSLDVINATASSPTMLEVVEDIKAGNLSTKRLQKGEASRIMTGAPMPEGADSVVMVENTQKEGINKAKIFKAIKPGDNVRRKGEDIKSGELIIAKGTPLTSAHIGILASLGLPNIRVTRKPKVAVLATGDEVVDVDEKLELGKLRSSNTYTLYSQIIKSGGLPKNLGIAKDKPEELEEKLKQGLDCDMILTSGGVSVGDYDFVKFILAKMGTDIKFWQVAMRPGKPLVFGLIQGKPILGLPGNPVSSMVAFEVFVRPALLKMLGQSIDTRKEVDAVLEEDIEKKKGLRYFLRAKTRWEDGIFLTRTSGPQGSGILKSMALANSLIILPEEEERVEKGIRVTVRFLD